MEHNIGVFTKLVEEYKVYYLRRDEEYIVAKYFRPQKKVLVLGCGAGRTLLPLYEKGFEVTGIDITPKMVEAAKAKVSGLPIQVFEMDACHLKFPKNSFDIVFFPYHGISYIYPDIFKAVSEAQRVMKPNGFFVFCTYNRFCLKALPRFFEGTYANYYGIIVYRTTPLDWWKVKRMFKVVNIIPLNSIAVTWKDATWKEKIYKLLPFFDASTYFICMGK